MGNHEHSRETVFPLGIGPLAHKETFTEGDKQYEGWGWTRSEAERNLQSNIDSGNTSSSSDSGSSGGDSGGGSCCYVTTACLDALGLPRDSLELRAMKTLTKGHILKSFSGKRDYVAYQRKGPVIVDAINSRQDSETIWKGIYEKLKEVSENVLAVNYERGHRLYKELILGLEAQFVQ